MAVVSKADHSVVSVSDRPTVIMVMADGTQRAFTGVTCMYGGHSGGTLTVRHDGGTSTFKVDGAPGRYVPRRSANITSVPVKGFMVLTLDGDVLYNHALHRTLWFVKYRSETL